jgi:tRNA1(Val) A37 N6-methylase TrmN6
MADEWTREEPLPGLVIWQPRRGFRYGAEAFWLAGFALEGGRPRTALDLGTGSGIVAGLLAARGVVTDGVDVRPEWEAGWSRSRADSRAFPALRVADVLAVDGAWDLVVSNPPYFPSGTGPTSPDEWKAAARSERTRALADFVAVATRVAPRCCFVVPVEREADVLAASRHPASRIARVGRRRVLVELCAGRATPPTIEVLDEKSADRWYAVVRGVSSGSEGL